MEVVRSKYKPEYCELVVKMSANGYSFRGFCGHIGVDFRTGVTWRAQLPEFDQACREAEMKRHLFYEHTALTNLKNKDFNNALFKGLASSIVRWREANEVNVNLNGEVDAVNLDAAVQPKFMTTFERREKIKALQAELKIE